MIPLELHTWYYSYVLRNIANGRWYTGYTNNLRKRLRQHTNRQSTYTKYRGPYELIYYEACRNKEDAQSREKYLKSGMGKRYIHNRLKCFLTLTG